ncbi:MAG: bifunctional DNA-formamidopyrimidine glycosylase/DNA-(apurinic or apyrimidinic site) lyase [Mycoplasmatales bacterium]|nr:bifunctional DNA-formamidopyrimidine glycosylase/DNA-(apurinic or apyrimidinic site) lyase [Mycoplasmatales bacterium]
MPELPEVRTVSRALNEAVKDRVISNVKVFREKTIVGTSPKKLILAVGDAKIERVTNIGKWIVYLLDNDKVLLSHLRMTGKYYYYKDKQKPTKHTHVVFDFKDGSQLHFEDYRGFGTLELKDKKDYLDVKPLSKLAEEPQNMNYIHFWDKLQKSRRAIKTLILDQTIVLGFGNIYVDETLWELRIHPETPGNQISQKQAKDILKFGTYIMDWSTSLGGSTVSTYSSINNIEGSFSQYLKIFRKDGKPCPRCKSTIVKTKVNGRGTHTCPECQVKFPI